MENAVGCPESDSDDEPLIKLAKRSSSQQSLVSKASSSTSSASSDSTAPNDKPPSSSTASKPLTAFAHFFNDTQHTIRKKNSAATFQEVSQVVMSMWQNLEADAKLVYQKREEEDRIRFENTVHSIVPKLIEKGDTQSDAAASESADTMKSDQTSSASTSQSQNTPEQVVMKEPTPSIAKTSESQTLTKPVIIGSMPKQRQVITLNESNRIIIYTKPVSPPPTLTPAPASTPSNVKAITIIGKPNDTPAVAPVCSSSPASSVKSNSGSDSRCSTPEDRIPPTKKKCRNTACEKFAINHDKWEDYCSSKCVVEDCHERFKAWVAARN
ncbi:TOX high mobility group box family member 4-like [Watersipora subatra]|uniref:TOX high mobility group box family member 4-like n=1 Tax=Watersipora subatra TaxID=2589382 RepID=UPI00355B9AA7